MPLAVRARPSSSQRGYDWRWRRASRAFLRAHPLCVMCERAGRVTAATVVDHIVRHRQDPLLFWDRCNWQPLCKVHHDSAKQSIERRGYDSAVAADGWPLDAAHPANCIS